LSCLVSPNATYHQLFEHFDALDTQGAVNSHSFRRPSAFRVPDLSPDHMLILRDALKALAEAPESLQRRVRFSLRWLLAGTQDFGPDAFLKFWIALESLTMTSEKTGPLLDLLAGAYGQNRPWVQNKLKIDRLAQLRGRIVHNGDRSPVSGNFLRYLVALYEDSLATKLTLPFKARALALADEGTIKFL
jgi:hypothetical protein